jgi:hypothetical protein
MSKVLKIEDLSKVITNLSGVQCSYYSEACVVVLEELSHKPGVEVIVNGTTYQLSWTSKPNANGWKEVKKKVENAATAVAFFLVAEQTEYTVIEEALIGTGVDYWLCFDEGHELYDEDNFMNARLEISGIYNNASGLTTRVKQKLKQTEPSDAYKVPAYVSVTEFSTPTAVLIKKQ